MASSEARGGGGGSSPPIGLWSMQNRTFLVVLRRVFCEKSKIAPPYENSPPLKRLNFRFGRKNQSQNRWRPFFLETTWFWAEKSFEFRISAEKSVSISVKTFFFFFGDHLSLGGKNDWIFELSEKFRINFRTNRVKLIQDQWKFGSRSSANFSLFQNSPPPFPNPGYAPVYGTATWRSGKGRGLGKTKFLLRIPVVKEVDPKTPSSETLPLQPISTKTNL